MYTDAIQIRVGLRRCLEKMNAFVKERSLKIETFYEVYDHKTANYIYTLPPASD